MMRIVVVDDRQAVRDGLEALLIQLGHTVASLGHPRLVLNLVETGAIDLVLTDYDMPEMNGLAVARQVAESRFNIPVVIMSGQANMVRALPDSCLATAIIDKPVTIQTIQSLVKGLGTDTAGRMDCVRSGS